MSSLSVVEHFDVFEDRSACFILRLKGVAAQVQFVLKRSEEAFNRGVVVAAPPKTHRDRKSLSSKQTLVLVTRVLTPLVAVVQQAGSGPTFVYGILEGIDRHRFLPAKKHTADIELELLDQ